MTFSPQSVFYITDNSHALVCLEELPDAEVAHERRDKRRPSVSSHYSGDVKMTHPQIYMYMYMYKNKTQN